MFGCIITVKSVTYAMKGEALLRKNGFACRVVKPDGEGSCKYGISLSCNYVKQATAILAAASIPIEAVIA